MNRSEDSGAPFNPWIDGQPGERCYLSPTYSANPIVWVGNTTLEDPGCGRRNASATPQFPLDLETLTETPFGQDAFSGLHDPRLLGSAPGSGPPLLQTSIPNPQSAIPPPNIPWIRECHPLRGSQRPGRERARRHRVEFHSSSLGPECHKPKRNSKPKPKPTPRDADPRPSLGTGFAPLAGRVSPLVHRSVAGPRPGWLSALVPGGFGRAVRVDFRPVS
ncbi:uncharacterized protein N7459_006320 [Penicillium hispanicum]|uniref:uncharacterized protein n=1 Tax=Penicillium hispanicum TaxID=1080232 RepID=UPI00253F77CF|nr:uncharacterized protein N7459_006320 [Penicillium hispanicum]KAJ5580335.1 hypothetical protein N7459_006320 [Penicillium hispanicum]